MFIHGTRPGIGKEGETGEQGELSYHTVHTGQDSCSPPFTFSGLSLYVWVSVLRL